MTVPRAFLPDAVLGRRPARVLRQSVSWWLSEIDDLLPRLSAMTGANKEPALVLDIARDQATLTVHVRGRIAASLPLGADVPDVRSRVLGLLRRHRLSDFVHIRLDPALVLLTSVDLPQAAASSLRPILEHQLERLVPLPASDVCFAFRIARAASAGSSTAALSVAVAIVKRKTLDGALEIARSAGLATRTIAAAPAADEPAGLAPYEFWRAGRAEAEAPARRRLKRLLELACIGLLIAAYGVYVTRLEWLRDDLRRQIAAVEQDARKAQEVGRGAAATAQALDFFESKRRDTAPLQSLDLLTKLVPTDAWANDLALRGRTGELTGVSPHAADLIAQFEASPAFEKPEFKSPITFSPDGKGERFVLTFAIRQRAP
jgi:Tfp pilus assembly protein PilN